MASNIVEETDETPPICGICLDSFHSPRVLPCRHIFCGECLGGWLKKSTNMSILTCPNCMQETTVPEGGIKEFPAPTENEEITEGTNEDQTKTLCGNCNNPIKKVTVCCLDCPEFMCHACYTSHQNFKSLEGHQVVSLEELNKGVSLLSKKNRESKEMFCKKHNEKKKFYCKSCQKAVCRDCIVMTPGCSQHNFVTLKEMYQTQVSFVKQEMNKCSKRKEKFQHIIKETEELEKHLDKNAREATQVVAKIRQDYLNIIEEKAIYLTHKVNYEHSKKRKELQDIKLGLLDIVAKCENVHSTVSLSLENASEHDMTSTAKASSLVSKFKELEQHKPAQINTDLSYIHRPVLPFIFGECETWKELAEIEIPFAPVGVACGINDEIGVIGTDTGCIVLRSGLLTAKLNLECEDASDIAFSKENRYLVSDHRTHKCYKYNSKGHLLSYIRPLDEENNPSPSCAVHVDSDGCILLGRQNTICLYKPDNTIMSKVNTEDVPWALTTTVNKHIAVVFEHDKIVLMDYSGNIIKVMESPSDWKEWTPCSICRSKLGDIFVLNTSDPYSVHRYSVNGNYLGCVIPNLHDPHAIAMSSDGQKLYVVENADNVIKIFQRPAHLD